jgi:hypothetical protein
MATNLERRLAKAERVSQADESCDWLRWMAMRRREPRWNEPLESAGHLLGAVPARRVALQAALHGGNRRGR